MKIYNVFHDNLFQKTSIDLLKSLINELGPLIIVNNEEECKVKQFLDARSFERKIKYCVEYTDWDENRD